MTRSRTFAGAAVAAALAGAALLPTQADAAAGSVHLYRIYYDSPGVDRGSNASLNAEWVQIANTTAKSVSLKGWVLADASNHKYTFGTYAIGAHRILAVHTGKGKDTSVNRYQNRAAYVWNNDKDTATLKKANGAKVDTCSYNSTKVDYKAC
ncbi:lamin tail domain-containing protein [Actinacidiphila sp. ITFR-21]|uniref:lamin tail domain-containing protein n=1 Tax=Actinacidiphila sp. ITFR-21 TaxID=3075199 RepID=UPI00288A36D4|nr:lamin tail domain-containing protein [Streptomyces sp. ITFR-21]WNI18984.1 lamin tail domain-containing protein [Streptomyces sp. ITFR-21]